LREEVRKLEEKKDLLVEDCKNVRLRVGKLKQKETALKGELNTARARHNEALKRREKAFKKESDTTIHNLNNKALKVAQGEEKLLKDKEEVKKRLLIAKGIQERAREKEKALEKRTGELQKKEADLSKKKMAFEKDRLAFEQNQLGESDAIDKAVEAAIAKKEVGLQQREAVVVFKEKAFSKKKRELDNREKALKIEEIRLKDKVRTFEANQ